MEPGFWFLYGRLSKVVKLIICNFNVKVRRNIPFKSEICVGKEGLWKLLRDFQEIYGKAIQVGVIGEFQFNTFYVLISYLPRIFLLRVYGGLAK